MKWGGGRGGIAFLAILGAAHLLVRTALYGPVIDGDSVRFLSTAQNFLAGEGWRDFTGRPHTGWPPLFPLLLATLGWVGIDPVEGGGWVHAAAFGLIIWLAGLYLHSNLRSRLLVLAATAIIATSLLLSTSMVWFLTEPLFVLFVFLSLLQLAAFLRTRRQDALYGAAVFTALAALTRYPGVVLIGVGVLLLLVRRAPPLAIRLKDAIAFGAVSSVPLAAVLTHNFAISGGLTGRKEASGQSLSAGLSQIVEVFGEWVVPQHAGWVAYLLWLMVGLVGIGLVGGRLARPRRRSNSYMTYEPPPPSVSVGLGPALPFGVFAVAYLVFMITIVPFTVGQGIDSRYLLPIYVPLLLAAVVLLDRFLSIEATGRMVAIRSVLMSLVLLMSLAHVSFSVINNLHITHPEWSFNSRVPWESSEILHYIRDNPINGHIFSDNPYLTWFWSRTAAREGERWHHHLPAADIRNFTSKIMGDSDDGRHLLWFRKWKWEHNYDFNDFDIRCLPGVDVVAELSDGVVFRVTAAEPFDAKRHRACKQSYVQQLVEQAGERVVHADSTWPISTWGEGVGEQVARAGWDVYRNGRKLTYRKQPCAPADVHTRFLLQVIPDDPADLSADRQQHGFDNLDFNFRTHGGVRLDDQCVATAQLPDYPIGRIYIGRWIDGNRRTLWEAEFSESR